VLRLRAHAELACKPGHAVLRGPDPVRSQVGVVAVDNLRAHLAARPVTRLEHHDRAARGTHAAGGAQSAQPRADDRHVDGCG
jgi:hypothetical protein